MAKNTIIENKLLAVDIGGFTIVPIGTIASYPVEQAPLGWLICDGSEFSASDYPELYAILNGKLPDLRGQFIRGLDRSKGIDAGRVLLSEQGDAIMNIKGNFRTYMIGNKPAIFNSNGFITQYIKTVAGISQVRFNVEPEYYPILDLGRYSLQTTLQSADGDSYPTCQAYFEKNNQTGAYEAVFQLYKAGVRWTAQLNCVVSWLFVGDWMSQAFRL